MKITPYTEIQAAIEAKDYSVIDGPILVSGMPNEVYHSIPGVSNSVLSALSRSPAHYAYRQSKPPSRAMEIGTALHTAVLEPERFEAEYMLLAGVTDRRASEYKQASAKLGTERVLTGTEATYVTGIVSALERNLDAMKILRCDGYAELSIFAKDPRTGLLCKCRTDKIALPEDGRVIVADLKKTQDVRDDQLSRTIYNYRYYVQQPFYMDVIEWATGMPVDEWAFIFSEEKPPHANRVVYLYDTDIEQGREQYRRDLDTYLECKESGEWPGIVAETGYVSLPTWAQEYPEFETAEE